MRTTTDGRLPGGLGFPLGGAAVVVAAIVTDLGGATAHPVYALVALVLVVLGAAAVTTPAATTGVALVAWAVDSGFVLGREGRLVFDAATGRAALVLAAATVLGLAASAIVRAARRSVAVPRLAVVPAPRAPEPQRGTDRVASA
ncbi:hypothetical protein [Amycolatopsis saalfeldensis]|uniref:DUF4118 domain-containing protein n=1 Tax=Amycolatopsis saalfeldensis TaxID=394193 RepID=A0A1H8YKS5_9PSEU|nr:hypothetical protein [Amycolatopsis saalfeldensis]SEP52756.1 hypothetical protein SAMN04489732_12241 [Amycolatopsis saalfeldensis]